VVKREREEAERKRSRAVHKQFILAERVSEARVRLLHTTKSVDIMDLGTVFKVRVRPEAIRITDGPYRLLVH
jgi:hypothetical protein